MAGGALDHESAGHAAALGLGKGLTFHPDVRLWGILTRGRGGRQRDGPHGRFPAAPEEGFGYYGPSSSRVNSMFVGGYGWTRPPRPRQGLVPREQVVRPESSSLAVAP